MTPSEEMIPRRLRFKIASHVRTEDLANPLFKFGGWNRVAENRWELGRFKKKTVLGGRAVGTTTRLSGSGSPGRGLLPPQSRVVV